MPTGGGGGGGGGLTFVTTDTSLQGLGTVPSPLGLLAVSTDTTLTGAGISSSKLGINQVGVTPRLTGAGTVASKLDIAGWPLTSLEYGNNTGAFSLGGANQVSVFGLQLPYALTFSTLSIRVATADAVGLYDFGVYNKAGALIANAGAQTLPTLDLNSFAILQGTITIAPGSYLLAMTGNANVARLWGTNTVFLWYANNNVATSVSGALPASIGSIVNTPTFDFAYSFILT